MMLRDGLSPSYQVHWYEIEEMASRKQEIHITISVMGLVTVRGINGQLSTSQNKRPIRYCAGVSRTMSFAAKEENTKLK